MVRDNNIQTNADIATVTLFTTMCIKGNKKTAMKDHIIDCITVKKIIIAKLLEIELNGTVFLCYRQKQIDK